LFLLKHGVVKITIEASDHRELIVRLLYPTDFFGEMALLDALPRSARVTALEASTALLLDRDVFIELIERVPALMRKMAETLCHRLRKANELIYSLAFLDAYAKVGRVIINLAQEQGQAPVQGTTVGLRLSQRHLAELTGMARGTIARVLSDFQQAGYVCMTGGQIIILEPARLAPRLALWSVPPCI
jgi:CRP/FNR family transcriptional regulator, cyclic AMP receptor protein